MLMDMLKEKTLSVTRKNLAVKMLMEIIHK